MINFEGYWISFAVWVTSLQESTFDMLLRGTWRNPENLSTLSLNIK
jgi:hypothetical protein